MSIPWPPEGIDYRCGDCGGTLTIERSEPTQKIYCEECGKLIGVAYKVGKTRTRRALDEDLEAEV